MANVLFIVYTYVPDTDTLKIERKHITEVRAIRSSVYTQWQQLMVEFCTTIYRAALLVNISSVDTTGCIISPPHKLIDLARVYIPLL